MAASGDELEARHCWLAEWRVVVVMNVVARLHTPSTHIAPVASLAMMRFPSGVFGSHMQSEGLHVLFVRLKVLHDGLSSYLIKLLAQLPSSTVLQATFHLRGMSLQWQGTECDGDSTLTHHDAVSLDRVSQCTKLLGISNDCSPPYCTRELRVSCGITWGNCVSAVLECPRGECGGPPLSAIVSCRSLAVLRGRCKQVTGYRIGPFRQPTRSSGKRKLALCVMQWHRKHACNSGTWQVTGLHRPARLAGLLPAFDWGTFEGGGSGAGHLPQNF